MRVFVAPGNNAFVVVPQPEMMEQQLKALRPMRQPQSVMCSLVPMAKMIPTPTLL